jgi:hypothetical protein
MVRKIFVLALSILVLFILSFSFPKAYAAPSPCNMEGDKCVSINTAIGIVSTDPAQFVQKIFSVVLGIAGGIALILIIIAGYKFMTSAGNPESLKGATEQLTSAIVGLLFIILSFVILQIIGVDILRIPGFNP